MSGRNTNFITVLVSQQNQASPECGRSAGEATLRTLKKSWNWSSVVLAFENSKRISEEVKKPKALGDIRGISYIYPILWRFGLIRVPEAIEKKMGKQR